MVERLFGELWRLGATLLLVGAIVSLARIPVGATRDDGRLRLSLRTVGASVELCRERTPAELERLPQHMRRPEVCEQRIMPYRLAVTVDGHARLSRRIEPAGVRGDRPLTVDEAFALAPGAHELVVTFAPAALPDAATAETPLAEARRRAPRHRLEKRVQVDPGRILLVRLDSEQGRLVLEGGSQPDTP